MKNIKYILSLFIVSTLLTSCFKDLDTEPIDKDIKTAGVTFEDPAAYKQFLARIYGGFMVTGQKGPAGSPDITSISDEGFSNYIRLMWCAQELTTEEAYNRWGDGNLPDYNTQTWTSDNEYVSGMYSRIFFQISMCNEFLRQATDQTIAGLEAPYNTDVKLYQSEVRFLRAISYYHAIDMFGNVGLVTEKDNVGAFLPKQATRAELFTYVENELKAIENSLAEPTQNEYGRVDKAAAWMLLAKLYLNAKVYINTNKYTEALTYLNKVVNSTYGWEDKYANLFLADNHKAKGIIFAVNSDGLKTQTYGGTTFIINAAGLKGYTRANLGVTGNWNGNHVLPTFVDKFPDTTGDIDKRSMFHTEGQTKEVKNIKAEAEGYGITKFKNITSDGKYGSDGTFCDTDFPMLRMADAYLMYAEAVVRGGKGGSMTKAVELINKIRQRAYENNSGNVTASDIDLDFILDERAKELYWEGHRRTDLIRFGKFTGGQYIWPWKGGTLAGGATDAKFNLFPIPSSELGANPNLKQNSGY